MFQAANLFDLFESLYVPVRLPGRVSGTLKQHRIVLNHFGRYLGCLPQPQHLNEDDVAGFQAWLLAERKLKSTTANKCLDKLKAQWKFYHRRGLVGTYPELVRLREPKRLPEAWWLQQYERILAAAKQERGQVAGIAAERWWYALLLAMYYTGLRLRPLLELRWSEVDFDSSSLKAVAESQKQLEEQRFELPADALACLRAIQYPPRDVVFPWPAAKSELWRTYGRILGRAGLPMGRRHKFHKLRRTSASYLRRAGGDATRHLGHSSPKVTEAYIDPRITGEGSQTHLLPQPFGGQLPLF